jgi:hypothetical protein
MHRAHQLGSIDVKKVRADLVGNRLCQVRFADPWRAVKQNAARRVDPQMFVDLRELNRTLDQLADRLDFRR